MGLSLVIAGCSFDTGPLFPSRDKIPEDRPTPRRDADVALPDAGALPPPEAGPPMAGTNAPPPDMDASMQPDARVEMDSAVEMDAAADGAPPDADPPDAAPDDGAAPDVVVVPDATVCPDPMPCVCAQHAPITPPSDGCVRPLCPDQGCTPDSDCALIYDRTSAYYFCENQREWEDAAYHCELAEMALASIDDEPEDDLVYDNIEDKTWLGGRDGDGEEAGVWRGADDRVFYRGDEEDREPLGYVNWHQSEPNNGGLSANSPADCMLFWFENGTWADGSCSDEHGYVCEVKRE